MPIIIKNEKEIELMRQSGRILAETLEYICNLAKPGISTAELDQKAEDFIRKQGAIASFKGYHGFPGSICTCVNEEIVHGIPHSEKILRDGDLFTVDCGITYKGLITDAARSIGIGKINKEKERLIKTAEIALNKAISIVKPGIHVGEISKIIEESVKKEGFKVIYDLTGHGVGIKLHEEPIIMNYFDGKAGPILKAGMTVAIEPIFSVGSHELYCLSDNWTLVTKDHSCSVQAENTILVTQNGNEILTK